MDVFLKKILPCLVLLVIIMVIPCSFADDLNDGNIEVDCIDDELDTVEINDEVTEITSDNEDLLSNIEDDSVSSDDSDSIYISVDGDDYNNGSKEAPFKTFYRAVNVAKDNSIQDIYVFEGTYKENGIDIETSVNIIGLGNVIIDAENQDRIFKIQGEYEVELSGLTLMNGNAPVDAVSEDIHEIVYHADGGAVDILEAYVRMINITFINNYAADFGGAINVEGEYCYIKNCKFISNNAGTFGGAIDIEADNATVENCTFIGNEASNGGAIGCIANACSIIKSYFEKNTATDTGGAIFIENGEVSSDDSNSHLIEGNKFIGNEAAQQGGAIEVENQQMNSNADWTLIQNNEFINNSAYNGGAVSAYYGDAALKNNLFINNTAGYGGAIAALSTTDSPYIIIGGLYLKNNTIINCIAEENGNAIFNMGYFGTALNITFAEGKTVYSRDGKAVILNVTVCDDMGNPISGSPLDFTVDGKATLNPASDLVEGFGSVRFVPRENGTFIISGIYGSVNNMEDLYNVVTGKLIVENAIPDYFGTIHVSESEGDDDNTGAEDSPVKTFDQAFILATRDGGSFNIIVNKGTYFASGYTLEKSFNVTGIGNPILDAKNQGTIFSLLGSPNDEFHITGLTFKNGVGSPSKYAGMYEGGAIFLKGGILYLENDTFLSNTARDYGGAIHINKGMDYNSGLIYRTFAYIDNCTFDNNLADYFGGAISLYDCDVVVKNSKFISNKAKKGGAISILNGMGNLTVINSSFTNNFASDMGGALEVGALNSYNTRYFADIINSTFESNTANYGGAIVAGDTNITNCVFTKNKANIYGGAVFNNETFLSEAITNETIIKNSIFDGNTAQEGASYYGTSFLINNNYWGDNYNSAEELLNNKTIYFVEKNDNLTWANLKIDNSQDGYLLKFINNNGEDLKENLPDYEIKLSSKKDGIVTVTVSGNGTDISSYADEIKNNELSILNKDGKSIKADINVKNNTESNGTNISSQEIKNTHIIVPSKTFLVTSKSNKITIQLVNYMGNPLSDQYITFNINGKTTYGKTDSNGKAILDINLKVKSYKLTVTFEGDNDYNSVTNSSTIKIIKEKTKMSVPKKTYKKSKKSKKIIITLKSASGKALSKKKVTFKIKGKKYTAKTNKKGKAIVKVKLTAKKTYKFTVKFAGDKQYKAVSKKSSIRIK